MEIKEILDSYITGMSQLHIIQCDMRDLASNRMQKLNELSENLAKSNSSLIGENIDNNWLVARNPYTGKQEKLVPSKRTLEELMLAAHLHKNKQYQWLLAESYELFEDCLESLYAYVGYKNTEFWPLKDFGGIKLSELRFKDYEYFLNQSKSKRNAPASIINAFRNTYTELKRLETDNELGVNLYVAINLIASMRHNIVHLGGVVQDKDEFVKSVLENCGLYNSGNPAVEYLQLINGYFGKNEYRNTIILTETAVDVEFPLPVYVDELKETCSYLLAYIRILGDCIKEDESVCGETEPNA